MFYVILYTNINLLNPSDQLAKTDRKNFYEHAVFYYRSFNVLSLTNINVL